VKDSARDEKPLQDFIDRHPFSSLTYLERIFGERTISILFGEEKGELREMAVGGPGSHLAHRKESNAVLLSLRRLEIAREFAQQGMGPEDGCAGLSPGF